MTVDPIAPEEQETPEVNINVEVADEHAVYVEVYPGGCGPGPTEVSADPGNISFISPNDGLIYTPASVGSQAPGFAGLVDLSAGAPVVVAHGLGTGSLIVQTLWAGRMVHVDVFDAGPVSVTLQAAANPALTAVRVVVVGVGV